MTNLDPAIKSLDDGLVTLSDGKTELGKLLDPRQYDLIKYAGLVKEHRNNGAMAYYGWVPLTVFFGFVSIVGMMMFNGMFIFDA